MAKHNSGAIIQPFRQVTGTVRVPLHRQVYQRIKNAILDGALAPGVRLPSARVLASDARVSRNTTEIAFAQLEAEGLIERRVGAGSFVAAAMPEFVGKVNGARASRRPASGNHNSLSTRGRRITAAAKTDPTVTLAFAPCMPSLDAFPLQTWNRLTARRARLAGRALLGNGDPRGYPPLREAVAHYLNTARGVQCDAEQVVILSGTQQALNLTTRLLLDADEPAWIEEPGYLGARAALQNAGARIVPVPVDEHGLNVERQIKLAPSARLAYITPSHQYPLGVTMSLARRLALLAWAQRESAWIFEDDYDSEFRYDGRPLAAVQGLDSGGRVIYAGSFNKVMFPSLRIAYIVVPPQLVDAFIAARAVTDGAAPALAQIVMTDFIAEGYFSSHLRQMRALYRERRDLLLEAVVCELANSLSVEASEAGMHLAGHIGKAKDDVKISEQAAARNFHLPPLSRYYLVDRRARPGLILNYAGTSPENIRRMVRTLATLL
ncbi:MAG: PLP-dependent aminotransferase family protein [Chthoniobacterales bacterium]|nr:PLP-dependent aminotransferase family protein [Chthoniobacterales bacterium]